MLSTRASGPCNPFRFCFAGPGKILMILATKLKEDSSSLSKVVPSSRWSVFPLIRQNNRNKSPFLCASFPVWLRLLLWSVFKWLLLLVFYRSPASSSLFFSPSSDQPGCMRPARRVLLLLVPGDLFPPSVCCLLSLGSSPCPLLELFADRRFFHLWYLTNPRPMAAEKNLPEFRTTFGFFHAASALRRHRTRPAAAPRILFFLWRLSSNPLRGEIHFDSLYRGIVNPSFLLFYAQSLILPFPLPSPQSLSVAPLACFAIPRTCLTPVLLSSLGHIGLSDSSIRLLCNVVRIFRSLQPNFGPFFCHKPDSCRKETTRPRSGHYPPPLNVGSRAWTHRTFLFFYCFLPPPLTTSAV